MRSPTRRANPLSGNRNAVVVPFPGSTKPSPALSREIQPPPCQANPNFPTCMQGSKNFPHACGKVPILNSLPLRQLANPNSIHAEFDPPVAHAHKVGHPPETVSGFFRMTLGSESSAKPAADLPGKAPRSLPRCRCTRPLEFLMHLPLLLLLLLGFVVRLLLLLHLLHEFVMHILHLSLPQRPIMQMATGSTSTYSHSSSSDSLW